MAQTTSDDKGLRLLTAAALLTAGLLACAAPALAATETDCGQKAKGTHEPLIGDYRIKDDTSTTLPLGRHQHGEIEIGLSVEGCRLAAGTDIGGYPHALSRGDESIPRRALQVDATTTGNHAVSIFLQVTRSGVAPGKYTGTLDLDNNEVFGHTLSVPVTVTVQARGWVWILLTTLVAVTIVGTALVYLRLRAAGANVGSLRHWITRAPNLIGIGAGLVAAVGAWFATYWNDPTWGTDPVGQWWGLVFLMGGAYVGAMTAAGAVGGGEAR
jgi:hypothetical protein